MVSKSLLPWAEFCSLTREVFPKSSNCAWVWYEVSEMECSFSLNSCRILFLDDSPSFEDEASELEVVLLGATCVKKVLMDTKCEILLDTTYMYIHEYKCMVILSIIFLSNVSVLLPAVHMTYKLWPITIYIVSYRYRLMLVTGKLLPSLSLSF